MSIQKLFESSTSVVSFKKSLVAKLESYDKKIVKDLDNIDILEFEPGVQKVLIDVKNWWKSDGIRKFSPLSQQEKVLVSKVEQRHS